MQTQLAAFIYPDRRLLDALRTKVNRYFPLFEFKLQSTSATSIRTARYPQFFLSNRGNLFHIPSSPNVFPESAEASPCRPVPARPPDSCRTEKKLPIRKNGATSNILKGNPNLHVHTFELKHFRGSD
jgi:hypothetical protein